MRTVAEYTTAIALGKTVTLYDEKAQVLMNYIQTFRPDLDVVIKVRAGQAVFCLEGVLPTPTINPLDNP